MDVVSEQVSVYLPAYRRRRRRAHSALLVLSSWAVVYWMERQTGVFGYIWRHIVRCERSRAARSTRGNLAREPRHIRAPLRLASAHVARLCTTCSAR